MTIFPLENVLFVPLPRIYGAMLGYQENSYLVAIFNSDSSKVATIRAKSNKWRIIFKPIVNIDRNGVPTNAAIFSLTNIDDKLYLIHRRFLEERFLQREKSCFTKYSFCKHDKGVRLSIANPLISTQYPTTSY